MKITIDTQKNELKAGNKFFNELTENEKVIVENSVRKFIRENTMLSDYEVDSMWMSYRYCIGRHTIAAHTRAGDIWNHCKGRLNKDRQLFNAYDINREIEDKMRFSQGPEWHFPITSLNQIYTSAIDIFCEFLEDYDIKSKEDYLKYYAIDVILTDNERGYKFETITWEEYLRPKVHEILKKHFDNEAMSEDYAWNYFNEWKNGNKSLKADLDWKLKPLIKNIPNPEYFYFLDIEDLFVWNDLVHCFDYKHHHKSILIDGTECEWFWTWTEKSEQRDDGLYYKAFGYKKIRVPVDKWNGSVTTWIPDESIKEDIY